MSRVAIPAASLSPPGAVHQRGHGVLLPFAFGHGRHASECRRDLGFGQYQLGRQRRRRNGHDRGGHQVSGDERETVLEEQDVERQRRGRHRRHAASYQGEQFGARHAVDIGADGHGRLHADEDVGRAGQGLCSGEAHGLVEQDGKQLHDGLQDAEVVERRHERREKDHRRQHLCGQYEAHRGRATRGDLARAQR